MAAHQFLSLSCDGKERAGRRAADLTAISAIEPADVQIDRYNPEHCAS
jgi:hypothetical protein